MRIEGHYRRDLLRHRDGRVFQNSVNILSNVFIIDYQSIAFD
jgi:hypothetical protein